MDKKEIQEQYVQLQMLDQQIKAAQKQVQALEHQLEEMMNVLSALDDFKKTEKGSSLLVPMSSGIYVKAKLESVDEFIVNVGANIAVLKHREGTKALIENQVQEIQQVHQQMMSDVKDMITQAKSLQKVIQEAIAASE